MLSNEEREALEILNNTEWDGFMITIKNLIEKQSKEIEELKEESKEYQIGFAQGCYEKDLDWEDKIKAKIEEYDDKGMTVNLANRSAGKTFQQAVHYEVKKVLQSLLEKE